MKHSELPARIDALVQRLRPQLTHEELLTFTHCAQVMDRLSKAERSGDNELQVSTVVSQSTGQGRLDIVWLGQILQMSPEEARGTAWVLIEASSQAEAEADMSRFLKEHIGLPEKDAAQMLLAFRRYRDQDTAGSLTTKGSVS
jgi:hypothetical protein